MRHKCHGIGDSWRQVSLCEALMWSSRALFEAVVKVHWTHFSRGRDGGGRGWIGTLSEPGLCVS